MFRTGALAIESFDDQTQVGTLISVDRFIKILCNTAYEMTLPQEPGLRANRIRHPSPPGHTLSLPARQRLLSLLRLSDL